MNRAFIEQASMTGDLRGLEYAVVSEFSNNDSPGEGRGKGGGGRGEEEKRRGRKIVERGGGEGGGREGRGRRGEEGKA